MSNASSQRQHQTTTHQNRLAHETSPYLLQHKHNPVDWWPWGPEALAEAKQTNKPILLSVGYAACHWCHVMAHESFEDAATARVMNELFVNIKVDREERPDIDQIYMAALHHLGEHGGWPLTMFLTPDGEPIWGGTYFPQQLALRQAGFCRCAARDRAAVSRRAAEDRAEPRRADGAARRRRAHRRRRHDRRAPNSTMPRGSSAASSIRSTAARAARRNFRKPRCSNCCGAPGCAPAKRAISRPSTSRCDHICEGGIYDHLGGGFSRYSVDERWLVPHFEKMLYDNAQLLELLAIAYQRSGKPLYRQRAEETVAWLEREMTTGEGAFSASLDADSEGEEGKFYVWSYDEVIRQLGIEDGEFFAQHYDVTPAGNFEGHNILNRLKPQPRSEADEARLAALREKLLAVRGSRVRPGLDDKVLADWNGLMIAALVNAGLMLDEPSWLEIGAARFRFRRARR